MDRRKKVSLRDMLVPFSQIDLQLKMEVNSLSRARGTSGGGKLTTDSLMTLRRTALPTQTRPLCVGQERAPKAKPRVGVWKNAEII